MLQKPEKTPSCLATWLVCSLYLYHQHMNRFRCCYCPVLFHFSDFSAVFTNQQNQILLVKEGNVNKTSYGKYNLPGGHLELNEGLINGTAREIKEETGIEVYIDFLIGIYTGYSHNHCINYIFHAEYKGGNIEPQKNEILECNWFSSEQIDG